MIAKKIKILIKSDGSYLDTMLPPITANEDGRTIVQVIAPFPITDIVSVNYSIRPIQATVKGSYLVPTGKFGKDVLADDYTHFQTVADWNVFEIPINAVALEYISKYRAGLVLVSFTIKQLQTPYFATNYLGLFSDTNPIPTTTYNDGDYYIANEYNFTAHDITWAKGDYAYFYNGKWNKGKSVLKASTPSIELPVDPSLKDAPQLEYDEDVALLLANDLGLLTQRVSQSETDIESAENDINEIDGRVGVNETDIYNLESDVGNLQSDKADKTELVPIISELERLENEKVDLSLYTYDKGLQNTRDNAQENRLDTVEIDVANLENQNLLHSPTFNGTNGHLTFQRYGASPIVIDLPTEMIVTSGVYDDINNELVLNLASGGKVRIPVGNLLTDLDAHNIRFNGSGTNYLVNETEVEGAVKELDTQVELRVKTSDIVNNLTSTDTDKPLSANQGKVLNDTKENISNKATNFGTVNDTRYPSVKAVKDQLDLTAKLAVSNVFTQPQQVPNATLPQHTTNKLQVETMFEMFKRELRGYNLGMPNLSGATDLGNGEYELFLVRDLQLTYNVYTGIYTRSGTIIGGSYEFPIFFGEMPDENYTITTQLIQQGIIDTQIWEKPNKMLITVNNQTVTFITSINLEYIFLNFNQVSGIEKFKLKLEKGSTATPYTVPGQIPQYKIVGEE